MTTTLKTKLTWQNWLALIGTVLLLFWLIAGCEKSPNIRYVDNVNLYMDLFNPYWVKSYPMQAKPLEIYGIGIRYHVTVDTLDAGVIDGIKLKAEATSTSFDENTSDIYGSIGWIKLNHPIITSEEEAYVAVGCGDPSITKANFSGGGTTWPKQMWPIMHSVVTFTISLCKMGTTISKTGYCEFFGHWNGDYWDYWGGLGIPQLPRIGQSSEEEIGDVSNVDYGFEDINLPVRRQPQDYNTTTTGWCKLTKVDVSNYNWQLTMRMYARWFDANDACNIMTACSPYAYVYDYIQPGIGNYKAKSHTVSLKSFDGANQIISEMPIKMHVQTLIQNSCRLVSDYIVPVEVNNVQGRFQDKWGNTYIAICIPQNGHLEIGLADVYGDFNDDNEINLKDYSLLTALWHKTPDSNDYDIGFDYNLDGVINDVDMIEFANDYLE